MGIPGFGRWLRDSCSRCLWSVKPERPRFVNGEEVPVDTTRPNRNGFEFDNLYLDVNGLVHPCFHPEDPDQPQPRSYDEVHNAVFKYIDHIFLIVRPRKLLFLAIDGVAPRAKMNQQRSRRFKHAKEIADAVSVDEKSKDEYETTCEKMDSNVITPGTEFMVSLSVALQHYIRLKINTDPGWRKLKVILSDANVPGEGEHKAISYIRAQRNLPGFDPNTRHCFYGLDADLIMLALATHEIHFSILREDARAMRKVRKANKKMRLMYPNSISKANEEKFRYTKRIKFQFVHIWILREYLEIELNVREAPIKIDLERLIDDFVFMCSFVGNDFLPHLPLLEMSRGTINLLTKTYREEFSKMGGYLTNSFEVDLGRVEHFLQALGSRETVILRKKEKKAKSSTDTCDGGQDDGMGWMAGHNIPEAFSPHMSQNQLFIGEKKKVGAVQEEQKVSYYCEKFDVDAPNDLTKLKDHVVQKYVEGLCWFMHYYYDGICSWQWLQVYSMSFYTISIGKVPVPDRIPRFYPYHYAPFASDFINLKSLDISFTLGKPFKPFDQLMSVLPATSAHALPLSYRKLMTDPSSSIKDFYPQDFVLDINGKQFSWQAVCKLPFIDETRLLKEIESVEHNLTDAERKRNEFSLDLLFLHISHPMAPKIISFYEKKKNSPKLAKAKLMQKIKPKLSDGMNGSIYISDKTIQSSDIYSPIDGMQTIVDNQTIFVYYKNPPAHPHIPKIPEGAILPKKRLLNKNVKQAQTAVRRPRNFSRNKPGDAQKSGNTVKKRNIIGKRKRVNKGKPM